MPIVRITRFTADPEKADEVLARRADLIAAVRASFPGLTETRLGRLDDETWVDVWRWDSVGALDAAVQGVHAGIPEAAPAFALVTNVQSEQAELVDER